MTPQPWEETWTAYQSSVLMENTLLCSHWLNLNGFIFKQIFRLSDLFGTKDFRFQRVNLGDGLR